MARKIEDGKFRDVNYCYYQAVLGKMLLASSNGGLLGLWFVGQKHEYTPGEHWQRTTKDPVLKESINQVEKYFQAGSEKFDLKLNLQGTTFQKSVWAELLEIPYGETITYGELANRLGKPSAVRAAAAAVGRNPASIVVPCHRVLGSNGSLTGYAGGLERKRKLLALETSQSPLAALEAAANA